MISIMLYFSLNYIHSDETRKNWKNHPLTYQMGNIGSEVSRSLKWTAKGNIVLTPLRCRNITMILW